MGACLATRLHRHNFFFTLSTLQVHPRSDFGHKLFFIDALIRGWVIEEES